MALLTSPKRGNILGPDEQDRIYEKYKSTKDTLRRHKNLALKLVDVLKELTTAIDEVQDNPNRQQLQENVSNANKTIKGLLKQTSKLHERVEEFAESTTVLKR